MELELVLKLLLQGLPAIAEILTAVELLGRQAGTNSPQSAVPVESFTPSFNPSLPQPQLVLPAKDTVQVLLLPLQGQTDSTTPHRHLLEAHLTQALADFLEQHYGLNRDRSVEFLAGDPIEPSLQREALIKSLFAQRATQPTLVLELELVGEQFNLRVAHWWVGQSQYCYYRLAQLNYRRLLIASAKARALRWQAVVEQLLKSGESLADIALLAEDNQTNLELLQKESRWQTQGIDVSGLTLPYQFGDRDFISLAEALFPLLAIVAAQVADRWHQERSSGAPRLPALLPALVRSAPESVHLLQTVQESISQSLSRSLALSVTCARPLQSSSETPQSIPTLPIPTLSLLHSFTGYSGKPASIAVVPNSQLLVSGGDQRVQVRDLSSGQLIKTVAEHSGRVLAVQLSRDGRWLGSVHRTSDRSCIKIWDMQTGELCRTLTGHNKAVRCLAITPDQATLISGGQKIKVWDIATGALRTTLEGHQRAIYALALSPDGQILASSSADKTIRLWHLPTGNLLHTLTGHGDWVRTIALSPDGEMLASGSDDHTIRLWRVKSGQLVSILKGHQDWVQAIAFSPIGQGLFSGGKDGTIRLWQPSRGRSSHVLTEDQKRVAALAVSPDGCSVISGSDDRTVRIWGVMPVLEAMATDSKESSFNKST